MITRLLATAVVAAFASALLSTSALAGHCPRDVKKIDAAMSTNAKVKKMRDEGLALHKSGKHGASLKVLHEAMKMAGIKH